MFFFKRFYEYESQLKEFRVELNALKDVLEDVRKERDEFKEILFRKFGLIESENATPTRFESVVRRTPIDRVLKTLEEEDREKAWKAKAKKVDEILSKEPKDASSISTGNS